MPIDAPADPVQNVEAVAWFRKRVPVSAAEFARLSERAKRRAFTVSGLAQLDLVTQVHEAIAKALEQGTTLADFKRSVGQGLTKAWHGSVDAPAQRMETIFRTNVQQSYSAGRYRQMTAPSIASRRPYFLLDTTGDARQSPICHALSNPPIVLPQTHPFWDTHVPPLHFRCRSSLRALRSGQAQAMGITEDAPGVPATAGFGFRPGDDDGFEPDVSEHPPELAKIFTQQQGE